jgi:hypothetical protein
VDVSNAANCGGAGPDAGPEAGPGGLTGSGFLYVNASGSVTECNLVNSGANWPGCSDNLGYAQVTPAPPACATATLPGGGCLSGGGIVAGSGGYGGLPGGWQKNYNPCKVADRAAPPTSDDDTACMYDMCCAVDDQRCVPWASAPATGACTACSGVDYTVGIGCDDGSGNTHFPVCNRGNAAATLGMLRLGFNSGKPGNPDDCGPNNNSGAGACVIDLSVKPIPAGRCIDVNLTNPATGITCAGVSISGNKNAYINEGGSPLPECDQCNNWTATNHQSCAGYGGTPPPATQEYTYTAVCPPGTRPQWKNLAYVVSTPGTSDVLFAVQVSDNDDAGAPLAAQPSNPIPAADPPTGTPAPATGANPWPQTCGFGGPSPCPVDLFAALGGPPLAQLPNLFLSVTITSGAGTAASANSWSLTYDCVPSE